MNEMNLWRQPMKNVNPPGEIAKQRMEIVMVPNGRP
jgi:hypothetical protein